MDPFVAQLARLCTAPSHAREVGVRPDARDRPDDWRTARPRRDQLAQPAFRHAARHRAAHGRAVPASSAGSIRPKRVSVPR